MVDVVWMNLTVVEDSQGNKVDSVTECFLFGNNGVTRFSPHPKGTALQLCSTGNVIAIVEEEWETIFKLIAKIRGSYGNKKVKKTRSSRTSSKK